MQHSSAEVLLYSIKLGLLHATWKALPVIQLSVDSTEKSMQ